jgi:hypothetical protein
MSQYLRFWNLRAAYRAVFRLGSRKPAPVTALLDDLRDFCRADTSCIVIGKDGRVDTHATAVAEGRREVYLRIMQTMNLSDDLLMEMKENEND